MSLRESRKKARGVGRLKARDKYHYCSNPVLLQIIFTLVTNINIICKLEFLKLWKCVFIKHQHNLPPGKESVVGHAANTNLHLVLKAEQRLTTTPTEMEYFHWHYCDWWWWSALTAGSTFHFFRSFVLTLHAKKLLKEDIYLWKLTQAYPPFQLPVSQQGIASCPFFSSPDKMEEGEPAMMGVLLLWAPYIEEGTVTWEQKTSHLEELSNWQNSSLWNGWRLL